MAIAFIIIFHLVAGHSEDMHEDLRFITEINPVYARAGREHREADFSLRQTNEIKLAFTAMIRLYQIFVSPQGPPACNFTVTCSHFLSRAVRRYGFIHGVLMGADRLTRCTSSTRQLYGIDEATGRAIDYPVDAYYLFSRSRTVKPSSSTLSPSINGGESENSDGENFDKGGSQ